MSIIETPPATDADARIAELEATVAQLAARLDKSPDSQPTPGEPPLPTGSRRNLFKLAAGAAAGGTALALAQSSGQAAAADGNSMTIGSFNIQGDSSRSSTSIIYENDESPNTTLGNLNIFLARDKPSVPTGFDSSSAYPAAVAGWANRVIDHGVYGRTSSPDGYGVVAQGTTRGINQPGSTGLFARGTRANIRLHENGVAPAARSDDHARGEILADENGSLWYCAVAGTPGTWRKLAGATTAGAFHAATPFRVYDSRQAVAGGLPGSTDHTIAVKDARDVETYAVTTTDAVPDGATAVSANVVAIKANGGGFATVNPGGDTSVGAAALNWIEGQTIGNAGIFKISDSRELQVLVRGITNINLTIDITGYWL